MWEFSGEILIFLFLIPFLIDRYMRRFFVDHGIWFISLLSFFPMLIFVYLIRVYTLPIVPPDVADTSSFVALIAAKITFISVIVALGMFQYNYFFTFGETYLENLARRNFGIGWPEYVSYTEQLRQLLQIKSLETAPSISQEQLKMLRDWVEERDRIIQAARGKYVEWGKGELFYFSLRLALVLAIGIQALLSIAFDLLWFLSPDLPVDGRLYSQAALLASLFLFSTLFIVFMVVVQSQFRLYNTRMQ